MDEHFIRKETNLTVAEAVLRIQQAAKDNKFGVLNTLDLQAIMDGKGVDYKEAVTVVEVCSPLDARQVLEIDQRIAPVLPCRIAVTTVHGRTVAHTIKPSSMVDIFNNKEMTRAAEGIDITLERIINALP